MFDFSNEDEQKEFSYGPVPAGSVVMNRIVILDPSDSKRDPAEPLVSVASTGLRQLYIQCEVCQGGYAGVQWRQTITLPCSMQRMRMTAGQEKSARIGGAMLKAMLIAAKKPTQLKSLKQFDGLRFPVKVKLQDKPFEANNGEIYWRNEIAKVITPDMREFAEVAQKGEIINLNGAVSMAQSDHVAANTNRSAASSNSSANWKNEEEQAAKYYDTVPF